VACPECNVQEGKRRIADFFPLPTQERGGGGEKGGGGSALIDISALREKDSLER